MTTSNEADAAAQEITSLSSESVTFTRRDMVSLLSASAVALFATESSVATELATSAQGYKADDPLFSQPFIDIDEWRTTPVRHRYVHGGFKGTDALFSMYFPPKEQYGGRFFQPLSPVSGDENVAQRIHPNINPAVTQEQSTIGFAVASGAYLVESNLGKKDMYPDPDPKMSEIVSYRASAAVAQYSRAVAAEMYGAHRPYGYVYGGSGGAYKTVGCVESTTGVWDGSVPFVIPTPMSIPLSFPVQAHALRVLKDKFPAIVDAIDAGGSGDMYQGLTVEERETLAEVTRLGFPPRAWFAYKEIAVGYTGILTSLLDFIIKWDPTYFEDFWKLPGYLGANPPQSLARARVQHATRIRKVMMSDEALQLGLPVAASSRQVAVVPAAFELADMPAADLTGATLKIKSGGAAGHSVYVSAVIDRLVVIGFGPETFKARAMIAPGDEVAIDNSDYLAVQTYYRHQDPGPEYSAWDHLRVDGKPLYPQRPGGLLGPQFAKMGGAVSGQNGKFAGKMIVVATLMDQGAFPWNADWYRARVKAALGTQYEESFRLWYVDNSLHGAPETLADNTRIIDYTGTVQQALLDLAAWVEKKIVPPASTHYEVVDGQVEVPLSTSERKGIQPTVSLTVNGATHARVAVGQSVEFKGIAEVPTNAGRVVSAEWDFEGKGDYPINGTITPADASGRRAAVSTSHTFSKPGTYFAALRVTARRKSAPGQYGAVINLARVRVVVA